MKSRSHRSSHRCLHRITRILTLAAVTAAATAWSPASYACTPEPYISAVCVLAWTRNDLRGYAPAAGQIMAISQNNALFALLGTTYGGNGVSTFALPDLRGRTIIGAGSGGSVGNYVTGQVGGTPSTTLLINNLPAHTHPLLAVPLVGVTTSLDLSQVSNNTSNASLSAVNFNVDSSKLRARAVDASANNTSPSGNSLAVSSSTPNRVYSNAAPNVDMSAAALAGAITVTASGNAPVTLGGTVAGTLTGTLPAGNTGVTGQSVPVNTITPYVAMYYFIATSGVFPSSN